MPASQLGSDNFKATQCSTKYVPTIAAIHSRACSKKFTTILGAPGVHVASRMRTARMWRPS
jgi:hypothetical protein